MQPPDELMVDKFLPAMRRLVATKLRSEGLSQNRIASLLGTTQASVSIYLSSSDAKAYDELAVLHVGRAEADGYATELCLAVNRGASEGVRAMAEIWTRMLGSGSVCDAHRALHPSLAGCDYCVAEYGRVGEEKMLAIAEVTDAVRTIEGSKDFAGVMPEVSVNIACAAGVPSGPADIIAVPGRIVKVKGRAKAMLPPEAGASVHMARMLILAGARDQGLRSCINLRYDKRMDGVLQRMRLRTLAIRGAPRPGVDDPTVGAFEERLRSTRGRFDAVIEEGGGGIEPNVYIFAKGAREAADLAVSVAEAYSAG